MYYYKQTINKLNLNLTNKMSGTIDYSSFKVASSGDYSVYIPTIKSDYTQHDITIIFNTDNIGTVSRVDFAPFLNSDKEGFRQAFIHFLPFKKGFEILDKIQTEGSFKFNLNKIMRKEYWILLRNNAPVPETEQNIHQLAHNAKLMEDRLVKMEEMMTQMAQKLEITMELNVTLTGIVESQQQMLENNEKKEKNENICDIDTKVEHLYCYIDAKDEYFYNSNRKHIQEIEQKIVIDNELGDNIRDCRSNMVKLSHRLGQNGDTIRRIIDVVYYLVEIISGKAVADAKFNSMLYNTTEDLSKSGLPMTIGELNV